MIDTHAHLAMVDRDGVGYAGGVPGVLQRARDAGLRHIICIGAGGELAEVQAALDVAKQNQGVSAICGLHPHDAARLLAQDPQADPLWQGIVQACSAAEVVAVGETGLDYHYDLSPRSQQRLVFERHVALARELGKPLCIHTREAEAETVEVLEMAAQHGVGGVIHCFSGSAWLARQCLDLGFYLSIPGIVTFKNAGDLPEVVAFAPVDRLLVETDSPFLAPIPYRGKRNEPAYVVKTLEQVARIRGISPVEMALVTTENAVRLFGPRLRTQLTGED